METRELRKQTFKGMELYQQRSGEFAKKFKDCVSGLDSFISSNTGLSVSCSISTLNKCRDQCKQLHEDVQIVYAEFMKYLDGVKTKESETEKTWLDNLYVEVEDKVTEYLKKVQTIKSEKIETMSQSYTSESSSIHSLAMRKAAEAKAAKVRVEFAEKENELKKRQANIDADLELLRHKREAAALATEAGELANLAIGSQNGSVLGDSVSICEEDPNTKVQRYINSQMNDSVPQYVLKQEQSLNETNATAQFLLRKDLILSRLTNFNDTCTNYQAWKSSFQSVSNEMTLNSSEEVDLLIKYLGPSSRKHATSLRTAYLHNADEALTQIWQRLDERFGTPESVLNSLTNRLQTFPCLTYKDRERLYDLADILQEIEGLMTNPKYSKTLSYFDSSIGVNPVVNKLPHSLQQKWVTHASTYKEKHSVPFPPFSLFASFVKKFSVIYNDPSFNYENQTTKDPSRQRNRNQPYSKAASSKHVAAAKTGIQHDQESSTPQDKCLIHNGAPHALVDCRNFKSKSEEEKQKFLFENKLCYQCHSADHRVRDCKVSQKTAQHHGGERQHSSAVRNFKQQSTEVKQKVDNKCTEICGENIVGKSCAKIMLVHVYTKDNPDNYVQCYATIDEQSNRCLAKPELFHLLNVTGKSVEYTLSSCNGISVKSGREIGNLVVECIDKSVQFDLPTIIECHDIPSNRNEIPTPSVAASHPHLSDVAPLIPEIDSNAKMLLLLGRDIPEVHHVLDQRLGPKGSPFAQRLPLGWVVVGEVCLGNTHIIPNVNVKKTFVVGDGRASLLPPCPSKIHVSETRDKADTFRSECNSTYVIDNGRYTLLKPCNQVGRNHLFTYDYDFVFGLDVRHDDKASMSIDDLEFLSIMDKEFVLDAHDGWSAPLPFKTPRSRLPNNRAQALHRTKSLQANLSKHPLKRQHFVDFMGKLLADGHAEIAPELQDSTECWYLPIFGVYHPKKPDKIRVVFDSSVQYEGVSLNSMLLQGPDLTNSLLGVLLRFRRELVAVSADIEQMFYCFSVNENDRNYLRFFWHEDNDTSRPLIEYRMCKHVFGNSPSPAIATYGLRKAVEKSDNDVIQFVQKDFYVDDGLRSFSTVSEAIDLLQRTQVCLAESGIRLHKIVSNAPDVMKSFPKEDLATDFNRVDFDLDSLPTQRSLGLEWDLNQDCFRFPSQVQDKPVTKRGTLSTINSVFDPIGFLAPVILEGRLILRDVMTSGIDWDEQLPPDIEARWFNWLRGMNDLEHVRVPRTLFNVSLSEMRELEFHIFSDASEKAISAVVYIVGYVDEHIKRASFVLGKAKVAPSKGHTIPRLELCAAVLATELCMLVTENLDVKFGKIWFYTDSRVVLGYISNRSRRFYTYVSNRVQKIRQVSTPQQWRYIPTDKNPADVGTRGTSPAQLSNSMWLLGPGFLSEHIEHLPEFYPLVDPESDSEVRATNVVTMATNVGEVHSIGAGRFERFSSRTKLVSAMSTLIHIVLSLKKLVKCRGWHACSDAQSVESQSRTAVVILREVQRVSFMTDIDVLMSKSSISTSSALLQLDPFLDDDGLLRVGGRLRQSDLPLEEKHPIILPASHHVTKLLIRHHHESVHHQGRVFTEGAVRQAGYWIIGGKRAVSSLIFNCVTCKKLRGRFETQKMSDLPVDRTEASSAFSNVGVDVFGPWQVVSRRSRSSQATSKRWAVLFTCLSIRAIHIEVVDEMSSSAFINALRRFIAIRGKVKIFRSDRGSNFVGATDHIGVHTINVENGKVKDFLSKSGSIWIFNAPHSSHMGGAWERMIGVSRRILESVLKNTHNLTHDVLVTLMAEVSAIVNARPIVPVSSDPDCPQILSPATLLTMKFDSDQQPVDGLTMKDLYKDQWKRVQYLANQFWLRWRKEFLQSLQSRPKWKSDHTPLKVNDVVLLKDYEVARNYWPLGRVSKLFPSTDGKIRKVEICVTKDGKQSFFVRPVINTVLLVRY